MTEAADEQLARKCPCIPLREVRASRVEAPASIHGLLGDHAPFRQESFALPGVER